MKFIFRQGINSKEMDIAFKLQKKYEIEPIY